MKIFLLLDPPTTTAQMKKIGIMRGKPYVYAPSSVASAKNELKVHLSPFVPPLPLSGPISLSVTWLFPRGKHAHLEYRTTKPDTDNLEKLLKDVMTELGFWLDDAQVVIEHTEKLWSDEPTGISIEITNLPKIKEATNNDK